MLRVRLALLLLSACLLYGLPRVASAAPATNWMWIWTADSARTPDTVFFRQHFRLPKAPIAARLLVVGDDLFRAYLNGGKKPVGQGHDWTTVLEFDVTRALQAGTNVLAFEVTNTSGPGGLLYKLIVRLPGNKTQTIFSDARVRATRHAPTVWTTADVDDSHWPLAVEIAPAGKGVWGALRGAPLPDPTRLVRLWNIRSGGEPGEDPYTRARHIGDRMILSASISSPTDMRILANAGFTLFQTDSDHLATEETAPNQWNWREPQGAQQTVSALGLDWCYFPHEAFPPAWYRQSVPFTRIQCLEHGQPVEAFSPWDPTWPGFIDHGYEALANAFAVKPDNPKTPAQPPSTSPRPSPDPAVKRAKISALYVGIHGDYGEAGLLTGARMTTPEQRADWERRFGNTHDHLGWWCADPLARADFRAAMLKKYGSLERLNAAWKRSFTSPDQITYPDKPRPDARREWVDYAWWYQHAVGNAIEANLGAARKRFPDTLLMLPAGFGDEDLRGGNDNSLIPKLAARYKADVRSTHSAFKPFAENSATMLGRLGSASRFYNVPFWTEPPIGLTADQEVGRIFEAISQGAKGIFDWAGNALAFRDVYYRYAKFLRVEHPVVDVAMFYPSTAQRLRPDRGFAPLFAQACAYLRDACNFDIIDDRMVDDGALASYRLLILWEGDVMEQSTLEKIRAWVADGGVLLSYDFGKLQSVEGDTSIFTDLFGYVRDLKPARLNETYAGDIPPAYALLPALPQTTDYLTGDWYAPDRADTAASGRAPAVETNPGRWTGANASLRLPLDTEHRYTLLVRAFVPPQAVALHRHLLLEGQPVGDIESPGDVTYRFRLPDLPALPSRLATLTFQSDTFVPARLLPDSHDERALGLRVLSVQVLAENAPDNPDNSPPSGSIRRELDLRRLRTDYARRYGKGLTVFFPATRSLLRAYVEVARRLIYHLSDIDPARRDALPFDTDNDGIYATLFTDKVLFYNDTDTPRTKTITIPPAAFAAWRGEVAIPDRTTWTLKLEPYTITPLYLAPPPQELLFECENFTDLGTLTPRSDLDCSPGMGNTCVLLPRNASITTRFLIDTPGRYTLYLRALRNKQLQPLDILLDNVPVPTAMTKIGTTLRAASIDLSRGKHTLTLRNAAQSAVRADFLLLSNDTTVSGYDFAVRTAPIE